MGRYRRFGRGDDLASAAEIAAFLSGSSRHRASIFTEIERTSSRCSRIYDGPSRVRVYAASLGTFVDYRGSRRDCEALPMLIHRELRKRGALIAAKRGELRPRAESGSSRCGCACFNEEGPFFPPRSLST